MKLPSFLKRYFWDTNFYNLDSSKNTFYIIARLLEFGDTKAIKWLFKTTDKKKIKEVILKARELSPKSGNFWGLVFKLDKKEILCLKKSYQKMQSSHWHY